MSKQEANIDIVRKDGRLHLVSIALPIWAKIKEDGFLSVDIPMLNIITTAKNEDDVEVALNEALTLFCLNSEKFGSGLENELKIAGWSFTQLSDNKSSLCWGTHDDVIDRIMSTGDDISQILEISA